MTEPSPSRRSRRHPALASRILALGASVAATIGLLGAMAARSPASAAKPDPAAPPQATAKPSPIRVVVVVRRVPSRAETKSGSGRVAPRVVRRVVRRAPVTSTHGS